MKECANRATLCHRRCFTANFSTNNTNLAYLSKSAYMKMSYTSATIDVFQKTDEQPFFHSLSFCSYLYTFFHSCNISSPAALSFSEIVCKISRRIHKSFNSPVYREFHSGFYQSVMLSDHFHPFLPVLLKVDTKHHHAINCQIIRCSRFWDRKLFQCIVLIIRHDE